MNTSKKALLMLNLGTPDSPGVIDVGKYLSEFLTDSRMINIPSLLRYLLVNLIIVPTRSFSSSKGYKELWTKRGSPLKFHMEDLVKKVSKKLNKSHEVFYAMRYKNPSINSVLKKIEKKGFNEIILFPIFPQYSSATTGSFLEKTFKEISSWTVIPKITTIDQFYDNPKFINAFVENIKKFDLHNLFYIKSKLAGYTLLRKRTCKIQNLKKNTHYLLFDTLIIDKKYRGMKFSNLLMSFNNTIIKQSGFPSFLSSSSIK